MSHPSASQSLRDEFPALALTVGFAAPQQREHLADLLLIWLEINRARGAAESMIAAARITWWREAIDNARPEGVPLAERLLSSGRDLTSLSTMLDQIVNITLHADPNSEHAICHAMGDMLAVMVNKSSGGSDIAHALLALQTSMSGGNTISPDLVKTINQAQIHISFKLMVWLANRPRSLSYPEVDPLLPLKMMCRAFRL